MISCDYFNCVCVCVAKATSTGLVMMDLKYKGVKKAPLDDFKDGLWQEEGKALKAKGISAPMR